MGNSEYQSLNLEFGIVRCENTFNKYKSKKLAGRGGGGGVSSYESLQIGLED